MTLAAGPLRKCDAAAVKVRQVLYVLRTTSPDVSSFSQLLRPVTQKVCPW